MNQSTLQFGSSEITVHHQGAHLGSWLYQGKEQLFLSRKAIYKPGKPLRGGVPICFPQFGAFGPGTSHGFARNVVWQEVRGSEHNQLQFELTHDEVSFELWPHEFKAQFDVELNDNTLAMSLSIKNLSAINMAFTSALHTYFRISHISDVFIDGLQDCEYWNNGTDFTQQQRQESDLRQITDMIDRVYFNTRETLTLTDHQSIRQITSDGFNDTVVWNPWLKGARAFVDMADDEYQQMLCIESANVEIPVEIETGATWRGTQTISIIQ